MADRTVKQAGDNTTGLVAPETFRDESDGTFSRAQRARLEGWDSANAVWIKVAVSSTGAIQTSGSTAAGGGGAVTVADGANVVEGATTDGAVITDTTGTINGKLRGLVKWAYERMPAALGQAAMAASISVAIASNQSAVPVSGTLTVQQATASSLKVDASGATVPVSGAISVSASTIPITDNGGSLTVDAPVGTPVFVRQSDGTAALVGQKAMAASLPVALASDQSSVPVVEVPASTIATAVSSAAGAAITLSLASVAAQFHYITALEITAYNTSARTGGATPVTVTTTNITGNPAFTFGSAGAIGTTDRYGPMTISDGLKSTTAATATTIVCPATPSVIWRINVVYRAGT